MITPYPTPGKHKSQVLCEAFVFGAPKAAQGAVFYGITDANYADWQRVRRAGIDYWFIDNSYFDVVRGRQFRITKNRVQHSGIGTSDGARFEALGLSIKPMRDNPQGWTLIVEQSDLFMRLTAKEPNWTANTVHGAQGTICLRKWDRNKLVAQKTLAEDIAQAKLTVTHSSAAAVESLLAGCHVQVSAMSACHAYSQGQSRADLMHVLADNQFTLDEIKSGFAWSKVR